MTSEPVQRAGRYGLDAAEVYRLALRTRARLEHLAERFGERSARVWAAGDSPGLRAMVEALLMAALPTDDESRTFHHVYTSYAVLSVNDRPWRPGPSSRTLTPPKTP